MLDVLRGRHVVVVVGVDEEEVVRQPANGKDRDDGDEHAHHLPLRLHGLHLAVGVLSDGAAAPQHPSHQCVADEHYNHGDSVGQHQNDQVVAVFMRENVKNYVKYVII